MKTMNGKIVRVALPSHPNADPAVALWQQQLGRAYGKGRTGGSHMREQGSRRECAEQNSLALRAIAKALPALNCLAYHSGPDLTN